jgi:hydrogenase maturation protein HypF
VADIDSNAGALLASAARPIVLLDQRDHSGISHLVAPGSPYVGAMLAYTPLHQLLFRSVPDSRSPVPRALVLTSGNLSDEPICFDDDDARRRLGAMVDAWLVHDRPIHVPCDDSVMRVDGDQELPIRRSRGYAPLPIRLPIESEPLLATGGELKNTFCVASGRDAWMSQHIGDMGTIETLSAFERSRAQFGQMYRVTPTRVVSDAHPGYHVRQWAENVAATPITLVQHHHAHVASLMAEHGVPLGERITGVAFDGTGYGTDGAIWGGEILLAGYDDFERETHLSYVPLPGGDASIRKPFRAALAHLWAAGIEWSSDLAPVQHASPVELTALRRQLERNVQCVPTSSMGRLFDAVSSLLGVRHVVSYEAQAAIEMEALAKSPARGARRYEFEIVEGEFCAAPVLQRLVDDLRNGCARADIAAGFHQAVAGLIAEVADHVREKSGVACVGLSGGVFQNVLLVRLTRAALLERGLRVLTHRLVPPNDGGLALGQTAVASGVRASKGGAS